MTTTEHSANQSDSQRKSDKIKHIPVPKPGANGHYLPLSGLFGQPITEEYRPSLQQKAKPTKSLYLCKCAACEKCTTIGAVRRVSNVMYALFFSKHT